jgi:hypothetical protein
MNCESSAISLSHVTPQIVQGNSDEYEIKSQGSSLFANYHSHSMSVNETFDGAHRGPSEGQKLPFIPV